MSVVAAKVYGDRIQIAADSQGTYGYKTKRNDMLKLDIINNMIIGGVGTAEETSLLFHFAKTHRPETATEKDVLNFFVEFMGWKKEYNGGQIDNSYLLVIDSHLFWIENLFIKEIKDYVAIGSGYPYAIAAMYLGHNPDEAVSVACHLDSYVGEPIIIYTMYSDGEIN